MNAKIILLCAVAFMVASCGSSKKSVSSTAASADVEVIVPCAGPEFYTSADYFRANAMGTSHSLEISSQKAMTAARTKLAAAIEATIKTVTDNYTSSYEENEKEEARGRFQSLTREVVSQKLNGVRVTCSKTMQNPQGGQYKSYVAIELAGNEIASAINDGVSADSKLRTDFEYQKFREVFNEEMEKLAAEQN